MPEFLGWAHSDLITTGPDPFDSNASANSSSVGNSTITISCSATPTVIEMTDGDSEFSDGDSDQRYQGPADFNGGSGYDVRDRIETEYSYIICPQGQSDPADNVTIYMLEIDADGQGIAGPSPAIESVRSEESQRVSRGPFGRETCDRLTWFEHDDSCWASSVTDTKPHV